MRNSVMIKGCCTVLLLLLGLMGSSLCMASSSKSAQVPHLELFFSQIMNVDEYRNYKRAESGVCLDQRADAASGCPMSVSGLCGQ